MTVQELSVWSGEWVVKISRFFCRFMVENKLFYQNSMTILILSGKL